MPRWIKISFKILLIIIGLLLILWLALACYITYNKKSLLKTVVAQLNDKVNGELKIGSLDLELFSSFPNMSVSLQKVSLRDTLWHIHKHELLKSDYIYVDLGLMSLIKGTPVINQLTVKNGSIYLYTDSTDYSNLSVIKKNENKDKKKGKTPELENVRLSNVQLVIDNKPKFKYFVIKVNSMQGHWNYGLTGWDAELNTDAFINNFCFNVTRGSFVQNKSLKGIIKLHFEDASKHMTVPEITLNIGEDPIQFKGLFDFSQKPAAFQLAISAKQIKLRNASALLTKVISSTVNLVNLDKPLDANALLIGKMKFRDTPWVRVYWTVKDNTLSTPVGEIKKSNFTGFYTNQVVRGGSYGDLNSAIHVYNMKGEWHEIAYVADSVSITNLIKPVLEGKLRSTFALTKINALTNGNTFNFTAGDLKVDLLYKGGLQENDTTVPYIFGTVKLEKAGITYTPRNLSFKNTSGILRFTGSDLSFADIHMESKGSVLNMYGGIKDFLNLYYRSPEKALVDWHIKSPSIDVSDFIAFASAPKYVAAPVNASHPKINKLLTRLNTLLDKGSAHLDVGVDRLSYRHFGANTIKADILLTSTDIALNNVQLNHAHGNLQLKGKIAPGNTTTPFNLTANISHVNVDELFTGFDNFGQDAITDRNLKGSLTAEANIKGTMRNNGQIVPYSLNGDCSFYLTDGALINFDPIQRIGKIIFRRRDVSNVTFKKIENTLLIQGDKIVINPMSIESSVLNVYLKGVYGLDTGTNIDMEVPLRNPKKDELLIDEEQKEKNTRKGIVIYLKATDGTDGKVKIKWNQLKGKKIDADSSL